MHESRAERISLESEEKSRKQQAEFDALKSEMDRKEKEHEKTMDAYKNEIKSLTGKFFLSISTLSKNLRTIFL